MIWDYVILWISGINLNVFEMSQYWWVNLIHFDSQRFVEKMHSINSEMSILIILKFAEIQRCLMSIDKMKDMYIWNNYGIISYVFYYYKLCLSQIRSIISIIQDSNLYSAPILMSSLFQLIFKCKRIITNIFIQSG